MSNQYLVIKLPGDWIMREQLKQRLNMFMPDLEILDAGQVMDCICSKSIPTERCNKEFKDYVKEHIAHDIGEFLFGQCAIRFNEREEEHCIVIDGALTVIREFQKN